MFRMPNIPVKVEHKINIETNKETAVFITTVTGIVALTTVMLTSSILQYKKDKLKLGLSREEEEIRNAIRRAEIIAKDAE